MKARSFPFIVCALLIVMGVPPRPARAAGAWKDRSTACVSAITPAFLASIFKNVSGATTDKNPGGDGCTTGVGDNSFKFQMDDHVSLSEWDGINQKYHPTAAPLPGAGDKAVFTTDATGLYVWKSNNRSCGVAVIPLDPSNWKITGKALMSKLGEICSQLLVLP